LTPRQIPFLMKNIKLCFLCFFLLVFTWLYLPAQCINGDCLNGFGEKVYPDSSRFVGIFENGAKKSGTFFYPNGDVFKGPFKKNLRSGFAKYTYKNGEEFNGIYTDDKKDYGRYSFTNGAVYVGTFENNKPDGFGSIKYKDSTRWDGQWENGKRLWGANVQVVADSVIIDSLIPDNVRTSSRNIAKAITPRIFAVVVGIADYEGTLSDLQYSDDDARLFYTHLKKALPNEMAAGKSVLLLNKDATKRNIINALQQVFSQSTDNDFIIFYFSGHGSPGYFCPTDYTNQKIEHEVVKNYFKNANARYRVCIADACFSGSIGAGDTNNNSVPGSTQQLRDARIAVIMSSKPNQTSLEPGFLHQGLFSYFLIKGLQGKADLNHDSYITMGELFLYTKNEVTAKSAGAQIPVVFGKNMDRIPLARIVH
jgi:hypothetical protein